MHAGGRPTKYKKAYTQKALEYLASCIDGYTIEKYKILEGGKIVEKQEKRKKVKLPTIQGLSLVLDVNETTLYEWDKEYPEFSKSLLKIKAKQAEKLQEEGLAGNYNPLIAKLILSANHGMREKQDVTTDGKEIPTPIYGGNAK